MSINPMTYYVAQCDVCGILCETEYTAWAEADQAEIVAEECEWYIEDGNHLCYNCTPPDREEDDQ